MIFGNQMQDNPKNKTQQTEKIIDTLQSNRNAGLRVW